jgi:hypothetical protein
VKIKYPKMTIRDCELIAVADLIILLVAVVAVVIKNLVMAI